MKIYVACHCVKLGNEVAQRLIMNGHQITSSWLQDPFLPTHDYTIDDRRRIAENDINDIDAADAVVLVAGPDKYPGGKFMEAGYGLGAGKLVFVYGRRENMLTWYPAITHIDTLDDIRDVGSD